MPILDRIHQRYQGAGFSVIGVNVDKQASKARRIASDLDLSFPLLMDTDQSVSDLYSLGAMPYTFIIDRNGDIAYVHAGYKPGDERIYVDKLRALLR